MPTRSKKQKTAIVIGAGVGGLATAALLAKDGYHVTVLEKNEQAGGRASQLKKQGFTFDMGPSWYLMPDVFEKFFHNFGYSVSDFLKLQRLSPQYRIFFADKTQVEITGEWEKDAALFESLEPGSSQKLKEYLALSKEKYDLSMNGFLYHNMDNLLDMMTPSVMKSGQKLDVFQSMHNYVGRFFKTEKLQQIIQYTLVFLGGAPKNTPALYSLMSHIDFNLGVWYPKGGMYQIINAMVKLGLEYQVEYRYNSAVTRLEVTSQPQQGLAGKLGKTKQIISAVYVGKKKYTADVIVSNADYAFTETLLSDQRAADYGPNYWRKKTLAPSAFLLYLGIKGKLPTLVHHNLYFGQNWTHHFEEIFSKPTWPKAPSIYLNKTSYADPTVAPKGHEALFVLVPVAAKLSETAFHKQAYANHIIGYLEDKLNIKLKDRIVFQEIFSVTDFEKRYHSYGGTALGLAHTLLQTAIWRPRNQSRKIKNLFYVGANTAPGIGVPICLISAELVRQRVRSAVG